MKTPSVITLVVNYNRANDTIECIKSLLQCIYPVQKIVVLDNGSTDGSFEMLKKRFQNITLLRSETNLGFTGGINFLLRYTCTERPDYILSINNDTTVDPTFITHMVTAMEGHPKAAMACGTIYCYHDRNRVWYGGGRMVPLRGLAIHTRKGKLIDPETLGSPRTVSFVTGCLFLFRTSSLEKIGFVDERFFMYLDDIELSARIRALGFDLLYVPKAIIFHKVLGEKENPLKLYYSARNRLLFIRTGLKGITKFVATAYFLTVISLKLIIWRISKPLFFKAATYGLQDYFSGRFYEGRGISEFAGLKASEVQ